MTSKKDDAIKNKVCVIFDDIVNRGGTVIKAAEVLKSMGAKKVIVLATHGVLAGEAPTSLQNSKIDKIFLTDTIEIPKEKQFPKLKIVSIVDLIVRFLAHPCLPAGRQENEPKEGWPVKFF